MKKLLAMILALMLCLSIVACDKTSSKKDRDDDEDEDDIITEEVSEDEDDEDYDDDDDKNLAIETTPPALNKDDVDEDDEEDSKPIATKKPVATEKPVATKKPIATKKPVATEKPATSTLKGYATFEYEGITIDIPENYTRGEQSGVILFYNEKYPTVGDNIGFISMNQKLTLADCSKAALDASYKQAMDVVGGTYSIVEYDTYKIDGKDCVKCTINSKMYNTTMTQTQYIVLLDNSYVTITFTEASGQNTAVFETIASTIHVK